MGEEYSVEEIVKWRYNSRNGRREFFIKWLNYPHDENTWEPESNLNCPEILKRFIKNLSPKEEKYYFSSEPGKLTGFQRNATYLRFVGADGPHSSDDEDSDKPERQRQRFYCLVMFEDSDFAEEVTIKEFFLNKPEEAFKFLEGRLFLKDNTVAEKSKKKLKTSNTRKSRSKSCSRASSRNRT